VLASFRPEAFAVHTDVYDGPLELLLYLIRRDGIDVRDIPISHVTVEYLRYLDLMTELDLDVAGEFIVMAATLCQLKSRMLLPRRLDELEEEEEEDPRAALARRLLEYQRFQEGAQQLVERPLLGREVYSRPAVATDPSVVDVDPTVDSFGLLEAFYKALQRHAEAPPVHEVEFEEYNLLERITWVLESLDVGATTLDQLLMRVHRRSQRVLTFLSILELARLQMLEIAQEGHLMPVQLKGLVTAADADLTAFQNHG
jgi:segregation and condensation protein A